MKTITKKSGAAYKSNIPKESKLNDYYDQNDPFIDDGDNDNGIIDNDIHDFKGSHLLQKKKSTTHNNNDAIKNIGNQ